MDECIYYFFNKYKTDRIILGTQHQSSKHPIFNGTSQAPKSDEQSTHSTKKQQQHQSTTSKPQSQHPTRTIVFFSLLFEINQNFILVLNILLISKLLFDRFRIKM